MPELTTSNARIAYRQTGSGPDIVWVSGGGDPGDTWHEWQIPALPGYRHTTFDNAASERRSAPSRSPGRSPTSHAAPPS